MSRKFGFGSAIGACALAQATNDRTTLVVGQAALRRLSKPSLSQDFHFGTSRQPGPPVRLRRYLTVNFVVVLFLSDPETPVNVMV